MTKNELVNRIVGIALVVIVMGSVGFPLWSFAVAGVAFGWCDSMWGKK